MEADDRALELTGEELRAAVDAAMSRIVPHVNSLQDQPAAQPPQWSAEPQPSPISPQ